MHYKLINKANNIQTPIKSNPKPITSNYKDSLPSNFLDLETIIKGGFSYYTCAKGKILDLEQ